MSNRSRSVESVNAHVSEKYGGTCSEVVMGLTKHGNKSIGTFTCAEGHTWKRPVIEVINSKGGTWCQACRSFKIEKDAKRLAIEHGGECLSDTIKNVDEILQWRCKLGHVWGQRYMTIKQGNWCHKCGVINRTRKIPFESLQKLAESRGGKCLSEYKHSREKILWECEFGHQFKSRLESVRDRSSWCHDCKLKGETQCRIILEQTLGIQFIKARPEWMKNDKGNKLELDGYNSDLGLAFEFNGAQHYRVVNLFGQTPEMLEKQQLHDQIKLEECAKNGVKLIVIPYTAKNIAKKKEFIFAELTRLGIPFDPTKVTLY